MGKKITAAFLVSALVTLALVLAGCSSGSKQVAQPAVSPVSSSVVVTPTSSSSSPQPSNTQPGLISGLNLGNVLGLAASIPAMNFDLSVTSPGNPVATAKVYVKKSNIRMDTTQLGINAEILIDSNQKLAYLYIPAQNTAARMDFSKIKMPATSDLQSIINYQPKIVGTDTVDGKLCMVIEFTEGSATTRIWIWQERGLPVQIHSSATQGQTTVQFKNYVFSDQADSLFALPGGVQISDYSIPFNMLPSGLPGKVSGSPAASPAN